MCGSTVYAPTYRYPHLSCELLTCEVEAIVNGLSENETLMGMLWAFLDRGEALDPLLGRYTLYTHVLYTLSENLSLSVYHACLGAPHTQYYMYIVRRGLSINIGRVCLKRLFVCYFYTAVSAA